LAILLARSSAIALIAAFMPLGIHLTDNGVSIDAPAAHAKGGGGNGGGGGKGGGPSNGNGYGNGVGAANDVGPGVNNGHGAITSALGRGNAAHANEHVLSNAAPNSQVGIVASYSNAVGVTNELEAELAGLVDPAEIAAKEAEITAKEAEIAAAELA
jgi:hypothetical protein